MSETTDFNHEVTKSLMMVTPGPHVVLFCHSTDLSFSVNEKQYAWLRKFMADDFAKFVVFVCVGNNEIKLADEESKKVVDDLQMSNRKVIFDGSEDQKKLIPEAVHRVVLENNGHPFSHKRFIKYDEYMQRVWTESTHESIRRELAEGNPCPCFHC